MQLNGSIMLASRPFPDHNPGPSVLATWQHHSCLAMHRCHSAAQHVIRDTAGEPAATLAFFSSSNATNLSLAGHTPRNQRTSRLKRGGDKVCAVCIFVCLFGGGERCGPDRWLPGRPGCWRAAGGGLAGASGRYPASRSTRAAGALLARPSAPARVQ